MKVKYGQVAKVVKKTPACVTMAVKRGTLNKTLDDLIDLDDDKNYNWITTRLIKQGCEIPQEISALFKATPITENEKSKGNDKPAETPEPQPGDNGAESMPDAAQAARHEATEEKRRIDLASDKAKLREQQAKAISAETKAALDRRELVKIQPYGRLLFNIVSAERTKVINSIPNGASHTLDQIQNALNENKSRTEIIMIIKNIWQKDLAKIYSASDKELKNKLRQAKDKLAISDDDEETADETADETSKETMSDAA